MKISEIIDIAAVSTAPVGAWTAICQSLGKPWAHSGFIALGAVSVTAWLVKTVVRAKKKNARSGTPKRSKRSRNNISKKSISQNRRKNNSMIEKYFRKNVPWLREGQGFANRYEKRDIVIPPDFRGGKVMAYDKENREYYIKLGVCIRCRQEDAEPGIQTCSDCAERMSTRNKQKYANMHPDEKEENNRKVRERLKRLHKERISKGLCTKCGERPPRENRRMCYFCALSTNNYNNKRNSKKAKCSVPRDLRNACGLCRQCGNPLSKPTDTLCESCHDIMSEAGKKPHKNPTPAMLRARENFVKIGREFNNRLFLAPKIQKQADRAAIENFERMCAI